MLRLLIAEGSETLRQTLAENVRGAYIVRVCGEGNEALSNLRAFRPDIMILDLMLPGLDGITLLYRAAKEQKLPAVIALTNLESAYIAEKLEELKVSYLLRRPCPATAILARLDDLARRITAPRVRYPDMQTYIDMLLVELGIPTNLAGYVYLRDAIAYEVRAPGHRMTKDLYPKVGRQHNRSCGDQVERSIRSAIEKAWLVHDEALWRSRFPLAGDGSLARPTSSKFITTLAACVRIHYRSDGERVEQDAP